MLSLGEYKRGATLIFTTDITGKDGQPLLGAAAQLKSQIRKSNDELVCDLVIVEDVTIPGKYSFTAADTSTWDLGSLTLDIQLIEDGVVSFSDTFGLSMVKSVTR